MKWEKVKLKSFSALQWAVLRIQNPSLFIGETDLYHKAPALCLKSQSKYRIGMKIFFRFCDNCLRAILISKLSFIFSPIFLPDIPGNLKNPKMVSIVSRTGRQFQRYNHGCRQVVGWVSTFSLFFISPFAFWEISFSSSPFITWVLFVGLVLICSGRFVFKVGFC